MTPEQERQFEQVKKELGLFQLNQLAKNNEIDKNYSELAEGYKRAWYELDARIKTLEDARQRQIALNQQLLASTPSKSIKIEPWFKFWK